MSNFLKIWSYCLNKATPLTLVLMGVMFIQSITREEPLIEQMGIILLMAIWVLILSIVNLIVTKQTQEIE